MINNSNKSDNISSIQSAIEHLSDEQINSSLYVIDNENQQQPRIDLLTIEKLKNDRDILLTINNSNLLSNIPIKILEDIAIAIRTLNDFISSDLSNNNILHNCINAIEELDNIIWQYQIGSRFNQREKQIEDYLEKIENLHKNFKSEIEKIRQITLDFQADLSSANTNLNQTQELIEKTNIHSISLNENEKYIDEMKTRYQIVLSSIENSKSSFEEENVKFQEIISNAEIAISSAKSLIDNSQIQLGKIETSKDNFTSFETDITRINSQSNEALININNLLESSKIENENIKLLSTDTKETSSEVKEFRDKIQKLFEESVSNNDKIKTYEIEINSVITQSNEMLATINKSMSKAEEEAANSLKHSIDAQTALNAIVNHKDQVQLLYEQSNTSRGKIGVYENELSDLYNTSQETRKNIVDMNSHSREQLDELNIQANGIINENTQKTNTLIEKLKSLETEISRALQNATGVSLFSTFQLRKEHLAKNKWWWVLAIAALIIIVIIYTITLAKADLKLTPILILKFSVALPVAYGLWFCTAQYLKERRLEEEYAIKANISLSLEPYRELVEKILKEESGETRCKYADFVINSIGSVFSNPLDRISHMDDDLPKLTKEQLDNLTILINKVIDIIKK